jgi:hypothetical protein
MRLCALTLGTLWWIWVWLFVFAFHCGELFGLMFWGLVFLTQWIECLNFGYFGYIVVDLGLAVCFRFPLWPERPE